MADHQDYRIMIEIFFPNYLTEKHLVFWVIFYKSLKGKYFKHFSNIYFTLIIFVLFDLLSFIIIFINYYTSVLIQFFSIIWFIYKEARIFYIFKINNFFFND